MPRTPKIYSVIIYRPQSDVQKFVEYGGVPADSVAHVVAEHERGEHPDATLLVFAGVPLRVKTETKVLIGEPRKPRAAKPTPEAARKPGRPKGSKNAPKIVPVDTESPPANGAA